MDLIKPEIGTEKNTESHFYLLSHIYLLKSLDLETSAARFVMLNFDNSRIRV